MSEEVATLRYRAALLRITTKLKSGGPVGLFSLMVHDVSEPPPGIRRTVAPMVAYLSEDRERWWLEYGHPYRSHLRMEPGAFDLLVAPGRYNIKVARMGFLAPEPVAVHVTEGQVVPLSFALDAAPPPEGR